MFCFLSLGSAGDGSGRLLAQGHGENPGYARFCGVPDILSNPHHNPVRPVDGPNTTNARLSCAFMVCVCYGCFVRVATTPPAPSRHYHFFPNAVANAFSDNYFRGHFCMPIIELCNGWAKDEDEHLYKGMQVFDDLIRDNPFLTAAFAPHSPYTVTDHGFEQTLRFSNELQLRIHLNLHETLIEVTDAVRLRGQRPSKRIQDLGLLSPLLQTVHMTQFAPDEIKSPVDNKVHVAHCPESNLKLTSGFCQVAGLLEANVNVTIGTDGAASNNNLNMLGELRTAAILAKAVSNDATAVSAHQALSMAPINSARMLGLDNQIGSLEPGKLADLVAIDLSGLSFQPLHNPTSQLSSAATGHQVSHVWIDGIQVLAGGVLTELNTQRARANARQWHNTISQFGSL